MDEFRKQKRQLREDLQEARSNIHLSFDLWTSPNCYAIIAIVAHYINKSGAQQTKLLALRRLEGEHTGINQAQIVLNVIGEYKIGGKIGYFMLDNASSNDTAVDLILKTLYPKMSEKQRKRRRLRCLGHVVNLCAQAFLLGKKADTTLEELELAYSRHDFESIAKIWRQQGALGRLHNIIRYIRMSPQRREEFRKVVVGGDWSLFDKLEVSDEILVLRFGGVRYLMTSKARGLIGAGPDFVNIRAAVAILNFLNSSANISTSLFKAMQRDGTHTSALLYALLIASNVYSNSARPTGPSAAMALRTTVLHPTTGFFLKSFHLSYSHSTKRLCVARAINTLSTAGLLLWIGFLTVPGTPR